MKEEKRVGSTSLKNTDIFLVKISSCSRRFLQRGAPVALIILSVFFLTSVLPTQAMAADNYSGLVKCSGVVQNSGEVACNFNTFISMAGSVINWLFVISVPVAVTIFAYAGLLYMSGHDDNKKKARTVFLNVAIGFIIMLVAFTVVHTLIGWLVDPNFGADTLLSK